MRPTCAAGSPARTSTPASTAPRTRVDVRRIASRAAGRYNIQNIGIFLWSLNAYSVTRLAPRRRDSEPHCLPLQPARHGHAAVPSRVRRAQRSPRRPARQRRPTACAAACFATTCRRASARSTTETGQQPRCCISTASCSTRTRFGSPISRVAMASWTNLPAAGQPLRRASIDPELGRIALPPSAPEPHRRRSRFRSTTASSPTWAAANTARGDPSWSRTSSAIFPFPDTAPVPRYRRFRARSTLRRRSSPQNGAVAVEIDDSETLAVAARSTQHRPAGGRTIELRARDGAGPLCCSTARSASPAAASSRSTLNGLLIAAAAGMAPAKPAPSRLCTCRLAVPARQPTSSAR